MSTSEVDFAGRVRALIGNTEGFARVLAESVQHVAEEVIVGRDVQIAQLWYENDNQKSIIEVERRRAVAAAKQIERLEVELKAERAQHDELRHRIVPALKARLAEAEAHAKVKETQQ